MNTLITARFVTAVAYTLIHFIWEAAVLALPLALFRGSSRLRYCISCAVLLAMPIAFGLTLMAELPADFATPGIGIDPAAMQAAGNLPASMLQQPLLASFAAQARWFVPAWFLGVCLFYLRGIGSWLAVQRLRRSASAQVPAWCAERMNRIASALRIEGAVALLESCKVDSPVVVGFLRPAILFPAGLLSGLPVEQVEYLLIHELSHIRRADYVVNLLQTAIEGLLFYHPLVWWVSGVVRSERENCCDDAVLAMCPDAAGYARTLATLEQNRWEAAQAASGGNLRIRIRRLLSQPRRAAASPVLSIVLLAISIAAAGSIYLSPLIAQTPAQQTETPFQKWVKEDVAYIITNAERAAYNNLTTDDEREHFIEQFWERRAPEFKEEHYRRIAYANQHFSAGIPGWKTDTGRIYITFGPPDEIDAHPACSAGTAAYQDWLYKAVPGVGNNVQIRFEDTTCSGEYRMTRDPNPGGRFVPR